MAAIKTQASQIKPIAQFMDRGKLITQDFISANGRILAGYRAVPEAKGFSAWLRHGDIKRGYSEKLIFWFPTVEEAEAWVQVQVSEESQSTAPIERTTDQPPHEKEAVSG